MPTMVAGGVHLILAADNTRAFARLAPLNSRAVRRRCDRPCPPTACSLCSSSSPRRVSDPANQAESHVQTQSCSAHGALSHVFSPPPRSTLAAHCSAAQSATAGRLKATWLSSTCALVSCPGRRSWNHLRAMAIRRLTPRCSGQHPSVSRGMGPVGVASWCTGLKARGVPGVAAELILR